MRIALVPLLASVVFARAEESLPPSILGDWTGAADVIVERYDDEELAVELRIHADGCVEGSLLRDRERTRQSFTLPFDEDADRLGGSVQSSGHRLSLDGGVITAPVSLDRAAPP